MISKTTALLKSAKSQQLILRLSASQNMPLTLNPQQRRQFSLQYKPKMQINFGKENRFHLYHSEGGERFLTNCTRLNMLFIAGNSILLLLEIISPCKCI